MNTMVTELTFAEELKLFLRNNGMFDSQAEDVFKLVVEDKSMEEFKSRWGDKSSDYGGAPIMSMILMSTKPIALKYIDDNCPEAWFRPMFLPAEEQRKFMISDKN